MKLKEIRAEKEKVRSRIQKDTDLLLELGKEEDSLLVEEILKKMRGVKANVYSVNDKTLRLGIPGFIPAQIGLTFHLPGGIRLDIQKTGMTVETPTSGDLVEFVLEHGLQVGSNSLRITMAGMQNSIEPAMFAMGEMQRKCEIVEDENE